MVPSQKDTAIKADFKEKLAIVLPTENWFTECTATSTGEAKSTFKSGSEEAYKTNTIVEVRVAGGMANQPPIIKVLDQKVNNRGSVIVTDQSGALIDLDSEQGLMGDASPGTTKAQRKEKWRQSAEHLQAVPEVEEQGSLGSALDRSFVDLGLKPEERLLFDRYDANQAASKAHITDGCQTFVRICKLMDLPWEQHGLYRSWLIETLGVEAAVLPDESYAKVKPGLRLPYPTGYAWRERVGQGSRKHKRANHMDFDINQKCIDQASDWIRSEIRSNQECVSKGGKFCFNVPKCTRAMATARELKI